MYISGGAGVSISCLPLPNKEHYKENQWHKQLYLCRYHQSSKVFSFLLSLIDIHLTQQVNQGYCVAEGEDPSDDSAVLDPDVSCGGPRFSFMSPCKNNCRGGILCLNRKN